MAYSANGYFIVEKQGASFLKIRERDLLLSDAMCRLAQLHCDHPNVFFEVRNPHNQTEATSG